MRSSPLVLIAVTLALVGCPRREEPDPVKPAGSTAAASGSTAGVASAVPPAPSGSDEPPYSPKEYKEYQQKLAHEECEQAARHLNQVSGRPEFDKKGTLILSGCLFQGNVAWFRCVMDTQTQEQFNRCSHRYLIPPDEVKLKQ